MWQNTVDGIPNKVYSNTSKNIPVLCFVPSEPKSPYKVLYIRKPTIDEENTLDDARYEEVNYPYGLNYVFSTLDDSKVYPLYKISKWTEFETIKDDLDFENLEDGLVVKDVKSMEDFKGYIFRSDVYYKLILEESLFNELKKSKEDYDESRLYELLETYIKHPTIKKIEVKGKLKKIPYSFFHECAADEIEIPDTVEEICPRAFSYCKNLRYVNVPSHLKSIGEYAFMVSKIESFRIPDSVVKISSSAFENCFYLKDISIGRGLEVIPYGCFLNCKSLKEVHIPDNIKIIGGDAFRRCENLEKIDLPDSIIKLGTAALAENPSLLEIHIPNNVSVISESLLASDTSLVKIDIPDSVSIIYEYCFASCSSLKEIKLSKNLRYVYNSNIISNSNKVKKIVCSRNTTFLDKKLDKYLEYLD